MSLSNINHNYNIDLLSPIRGKISRSLRFSLLILIGEPFYYNELITPISIKSISLNVTRMTISVTKALQPIFC
jgi:hypothetical protein